MDVDDDLLGGLCQINYASATEIMVDRYGTGRCITLIKMLIGLFRD